MPQQQKQAKGGNKLRRSGKDANYYQRQFLRTATNKSRRAQKRAKRASMWKQRRQQDATQSQVPFMDRLHA